MGGQREKEEGGERRVRKKWGRAEGERRGREGQREKEGGREKKKKGEG